MVVEKLAKHGGFLMGNIGDFTSKNRGIFDPARPARASLWAQRCADAPCVRVNDEKIWEVS